MGEVIRKSAAAPDIMADVRATHTNATARGGDWASESAARLGPVIALDDLVKARVKTAIEAAAPAAAALAAENDSADALLGQVSDAYWNAIGRPAHDPVADIVWPGGFAYYADGPVEDQPDKMDLLADLLEAGLHPKLTPAQGSAFATSVRTGSASLRAKVEAARPLTARVALAEKMEIAIAKSAQVSLANLKRTWKTNGKSETEIHAVIPDRPAPRKAAAKPADGASAAAPAAAGAGTAKPAG